MKQVFCRRALEAVLGPASRGRRSFAEVQQIIINYNTDISQFWEWSGQGLRPIDQTNEAYKLGVNYLVYGVMH